MAGAKGGWGTWDPASTPGVEFRKNRPGTEDRPGGGEWAGQVLWFEGDVVTGVSSFDGALVDQKAVDRVAIVEGGDYEQSGDLHAVEKLEK